MKKFLLLLNSLILQKNYILQELTKQIQDLKLITKKITKQIIIKKKIINFKKVLSNYLKIDLLERDFILKAMILDKRKKKKKTIKN